MKKTTGKVTIITDNKEKLFKFGYEVPKKILESDFNWLEEEEKEDNFICYRGVYYHLSEFVKIENNEDLKGWYGYYSDSIFSGVLIKIPTSKTEVYVIGRYYS